MNTEKIHRKEVILPKPIVRELKSLAINEGRSLKNYMENILTKVAMDSLEFKKNLKASTLVQKIKNNNHD